MGNSSEKAIFKTLIYADIFDYPLKANEIWLYLISEKSLDKQTVYNILNRLLKKKIKFTQGFYTFSNRTNLVKTRIKKQKISFKKILLAQKIAKKLRWIPFIRFLGLSGSLAIENAKEKDDIDFFVITKANSIWLTRFLILLTLQLLGVRRKRADKSYADSICVNMFMDERELKFSKTRQNIYTAHEIAQLLPFIARGGVYQKFLASNLWIEKFLPNAMGSIKYEASSIKYEGKYTNHNYFSFFISNLSFLAEFLAKKIQLWYMKNHRTVETVTDTMFAFHKKDHKIAILNEFNKRLELYGL